MKNVLAAACCACMLVATSGMAQDPKKDAMGKDAMSKPMTMQECKDHMAMSSKPDAKKDDAMMKKDAMCADMMKQHSGMKKDEPMKK